MLSPEKMALHITSATPLSHYGFIFDLGGILIAAFSSAMCRLLKSASYARPSISVPSSPSPSQASLSFPPLSSSSPVVVLHSAAAPSPDLLMACRGFHGWSSENTRTLELGYAENVGMLPGSFILGPYFSLGSWRAPFRWASPHIWVVLLFARHYFQRECGLIGSFHQFQIIMILRIK